MSTATTTVAIAGISSRLAHNITAALLQHPSVHIRGSCRDISKLPPSFQASSRISLIQTASAHDRPALRRLVAGAAVVVCCYFADNATMLAGQELLVDLCEEEGVPRYVASDYTTDYRHIGLGDIELKDPMKRVMAHLDGKRRVQGVHVLVGLLTEMWFSVFNFWDREGRRLRYWGTGEEKWELTTYATAAEYVTAVALDPSAVGVLKSLGDRRSTFEIADDIEAVYSIKPELERLGSLEDIYGQRNVDGRQDLQSVVTYFLLTGRIALGENLDNGRYPDIKPEALRDFLQNTDILRAAPRT